MLDILYYGAAVAVGAACAAGLGLALSLIVYGLGPTEHERRFRF